MISKEFDLLIALVIELLKQGETQEAIALLEGARGEITEDKKTD